MQAPKTRAEIQTIIDNITFFDRKIKLIPKGVDPKGNEFFLLQVQYFEEDIDNPGKVELQKARKWYISPYSTESEIVETVFAACRRSWEHVLKEHFLYKGRRIFSPHFDVNRRVEMCDDEAYDGRVPLR